MKKWMVIFVILLMVMIGIWIAGLIIYSNIKIETNEEMIENRVNEFYEHVHSMNEQYVDDNPIKIGLYTEYGNEKRLIKDVYTCSYEAEDIMGIFYAVFTQEEVISNEDYDVVWKNYFEQYQEIANYKIGYQIKFTLNGEVVEQTILNPDQAYLMYPKLQFYLYDDVNLVPGRPYYHITNETFEEETLCTSVKLVGDTQTTRIESPIELTAFTYNGKEDFDPITGKYRGNSFYTITIEQSNR